MWNIEVANCLKTRWFKGLCSLEKIRRPFFLYKTFPLWSAPHFNPKRVCKKLWYDIVKVRNLTYNRLFMLPGSKLCWDLYKRHRKYNIYCKTSLNINKNTLIYIFNISCLSFKFNCWSEHCACMAQKLSQDCGHYAIFGLTKGEIFKSVLKLSIWPQGSGRRFKMTLQTNVLTIFRSCQWGSERPRQVCTDMES